MATIYDLDHKQAELEALQAEYDALQARMLTLQNLWQAAPAGWHAFVREYHPGYYAIFVEALLETEKRDV